MDGHGKWTTNANAPLLPPGVQLQAEGDADDENLADLLDDVPSHVEGYVFAAVIASSEAFEPRSLAEAKCQLEWSPWEDAIKEELATLKVTGTWELVDAPGGANVVGSKWVFRIKKNAGGNAVHFKARLVAQGFSQVPGIDYFDTFAPVAQLASIRAVLHLPLQRTWRQVRSISKVHTLMVNSPTKKPSTCDSHPVTPKENSSAN